MMPLIWVQGCGASSTGVDVTVRVPYGGAGAYAPQNSIRDSRVTIAYKTLMPILLLMRGCGSWPA